MRNPVELIEEAQCYHKTASTLELIAKWYRHRGHSLTEDAKQATWSLKNDYDTTKEDLERLSQRFDPEHEGF